MKKSAVMGTARLTVVCALVLACAIMLVPLRADAAKKSDTRVVWTAVEAEIAREFSDGVSLRNIINSGVKSGARIHEIVEASIKVGIDPSSVVYTAINEGYAAKTVVKAALAAGAPLNAVVNSAAHAGLDEKSTYIGDIVEAAVKTGVDPSKLVYTAITEGYSAQTVIRATLMAGASLYTVLRSATYARSNDKRVYCGEVVAAVIQTGEDPALVVYTAITQDYPAPIVIKAALEAGAPLDVVVKSATYAGTDRKSIYAGAADAGASPEDVENALSSANTPGEPVFFTSPPTAATPGSPALAPAPVIFGIGGIVLSQAPAWEPPSMPVGPLKIKPFFSVAETLSDNIMYTQNDKKRDSITTITPGLWMQLPFKAHIAELVYYSAIARYGKYTEENVSDHHVGGSVDFKAGSRFELQLSDTYDRGHEARSSTPTGTNEVFKSNLAAATASFRITDRAVARVDYGKTTWRFTDSEFRDRDEDEVAGAVFYRVFPKASVFVEYSHRKSAYSDDTLDLDNTVGTTQAGLTWDFSSRSKGTLKAGVAKKNFSSSARQSGSVKVGSADVSHEFASDTKVVLTARRSINEPDIVGADYFISTGAYAELTQRIVPQWSVLVCSAFVQDLYFSRTDRTSLNGAGIRYEATDWLEFALDYRRTKRQSNVQGNNYTEQSSLITINVSL